jgi:hypothetical protein
MPINPQETPMTLSIKVAALAACSVFTLVAPVAALAQSDGADYHPHQVVSNARPDVDAGAIAASHATGTEAEGQSTAAPMPNSTVSSEEIYKGAVAAAHPSSTEAEGQSTALPMVRSGMQQ